MKTISPLRVVGLLLLMVLPCLMKAQTFEGKIEVTEGKSHTVFLKNTYRDVLARANVVDLSWETASSDIIIGEFKKDYCEFKALRPTAKAVLYYNCAFRVDGWYRTYNFYWEIEVKSGEVHVTNIYVYPSKMSIEVGERRKLEASVYPEYADNRSVTWYSSSPYVSVDSYTGYVTGVEPGTAKVWAYADDNGMGDYCTVTVTGPSTPDVVPVESVLITNKGSSEMTVGEAFQLKATVLPDNATNKKIIWKSDNMDVVTVDNTGHLTAVGEGSSWIRALSDYDIDINDAILVTVVSENKPYQNVGIDGILYDLFPDGTAAAKAVDTDMVTGNELIIPSTVSYSASDDIAKTRYKVTRFGGSFNKNGDYSAFYKGGYSSVKLPVYMEEIDDGFHYMDDLSEVTLPYRVKNVSITAFFGCSNLATVTLGRGVQTIGKYSFSSCKNLTTIECNASTPPACYDTSFANYEATLIVPDGKEDLYKSHAVWGKFKVMSQSGAEVIDIEADEETEYFNLNGVRVIGDLTPGIYIKHRGAKISKVVVR